jgi:hypothetical protein
MNFLDATKSTITEISHFVLLLQVRSNAALALSTLAGGAYYPGAGAEQVLSIWDSLLQALENSQNLGNFSEYKHASTLRTQVCVCVCVRCMFVCVCLYLLNRLKHFCVCVCV